jgi:hypothetical protein
LSRGGEDAERDRQVEAPAFLAQLGRCEVDRDAPRWKLEARVHERRANAVAALLHFGVGKADDGERRQAVGEVHLDRNLGRAESR